MGGSVVGSWLLRQCVRSSNPRTRFLVDTFLSPTAYMVLDRLSAAPPGSVGRERLVPLEDLLRPVLHPSAKRPVDLHVVEGNIRFRSWVRNAYLVRLFGDSPRLREAEAKFAADLRIAPSLEAADKVFGTADWDRHPTGREDAEQARLVAAYESGAASVKDWDLEQLLECIGCCVVGMNEFNMYCERNFVYEFFTLDYIKALWRHFAERAQGLHDATGQTEFTILEVGAGNGQLSYLLEAQAAKTRSSKPSRRPWKVKVVATDTGIWKARHRAKRDVTNLTNVERLGYRDALDKYKPDFVLCSWMPMNQDWSAAFRAAPSVQEYVLIGEVDDGCCGHSWKTWGVDIDTSNDPMFAKNRDGDAFRDSKSTSIDLFHWLSKAGDHPADAVDTSSQTQAIELAQQPKPWEPDFERAELPLSHLQLSRYDRRHFAANSHTVSFRRIGESSGERAKPE